MKDLREKFIDSAMMKSSIIDMLESSECIPGKFHSAHYVALTLT